MYLMYFLSKMGVLQPAILVFQRVSIPNAPCMDYSPIEDGAIPAIASVSLLEFFFFSDFQILDFQIRLLRWVTVMVSWAIAWSGFPRCMGI